MSVLRNYFLVISFVVSTIFFAAEAVENSEEKTHLSAAKNGWRIQEKSEAPQYMEAELQQVDGSRMMTNNHALAAGEEHDWSEPKPKSKSRKSVGENKFGDRQPLARFQVDTAADPLKWKFVAWRDMESENSIELKAYKSDAIDQNEWVLFEPSDSDKNSHFDMLINQGPETYGYLKAIAGPNPIYLRIPEVLISASTRASAILGGSIDQRIVAIYFANKPLLDLDLRYRQQILDIPSSRSLTAYDTNTVRKLAAELRLDGFANLGSTIDDRRAVEESMMEERLSNSSIDTSCLNFAFEKGYLKNNLSRFLKGCGWTIGQWRFGDEQYEYDLEITKEFVTQANDLDQLLAMVETTYLLTGTKNLLDKTVDFQPSRGGTLEEMELKKW